MLEEMLAETTHLLNGGLVIAVGVQEDLEVIAHDMRLTMAGGEMAISGTGLTRGVMRASTLHFLIAAATLPAFLQIAHLLQRKLDYSENDTKTKLTEARDMTRRSQGPLTGCLGIRKGLPLQVLQR